MHTSGSILKTCLERIRAYLDEPEADKFTNDFLVRHTLTPAYVDVWGRLNMSMDSPPLIRFPVALVVDQEYYQLPPCIQIVERIAALDENGNVILDFRPKSEMNPDGPGWALEGNLLAFRPFPPTAETVDIWYRHNGDVLPHWAEGASQGSLAVDRLVLTLAATPNLGMIDRRPNAYAGSVLRVIQANVWEERVIASSTTGASPTVTVRVPFSAGITTGVTNYEIVPYMQSQSFIEAVSAAASMRLATGRKVSEKHMVFLSQQYRIAVKTLIDNLSNLQARTGKGFQRDTVDNLLTYWP